MQVNEISEKDWMKRNAILVLNTLQSYNGRVGSAFASRPVNSWGVGSNLYCSKSDLTFTVTRIDGYGKQTYNRISVYTGVNFGGWEMATIHCPS